MSLLEETSINSLDSRYYVTSLGNLELIAALSLGLLLITLTSVLSRSGFPFNFIQFLSSLSFCSSSSSSSRISLSSSNESSKTGDYCVKHGGLFDFGPQFWFNFFLGPFERIDNWVNAGVDWGEKALDEFSLWKWLGWTKALIES